MSAADEKAAIRREMRRRRKAVPPEARAEASRRICGRLLADGLGASVAVYFAGADEIDLADFIRGALRRGVRVFAPRWTGETYALAEVRGLDEASLRTGPHGIREPRDAAPPGADAAPAAWVVPGLAFTRDGRRLGYGGGWYDRLLARATPGADVIGVAYPFQVVDDLPAEPHDVRVRRVVWPGGSVASRTRSTASTSRSSGRSSPDRMTTFLINLDRSPERLAFMAGRLGRLGIPFTRVPAVDGRALAPAERARRFSRVRSFVAAKKLLSDAEIGVALSHGDCCRRIVAEGLPVALVLDDDVDLADGFPEALARAERFLDPARPQVAVFSGYGLDGGASRPPEIRRERSLWCADAYCLTQAAARLILKANDPVLTVADSFKRWRTRFGLELYRVFPTTARQADDRFPSENEVLPKSNWIVRNALWLADWLLSKATGR